MTSMAPVAFELEGFKSPAPAAKTPVQKRLEGMSPKSPGSPANLDEKLAKCEQARQVRGAQGPWGRVGMMVGTMREPHTARSLGKHAANF